MTKVTPVGEPPCPAAASTTALLKAVADAAVPCITLLPSDYNLTNTLVLGARDITLRGSNTTTLTMVNETHVVRVEGPGVVTLREVRLRGGHVNGGGDVNGGAGLLVDRDGTAVLQDVTVSHNVGGGILNQGNLTLIGSTIVDNLADGYYPDGVRSLLPRSEHALHLNPCAHTAGDARRAAAARSAPPTRRTPPPRAAEARPSH